MSVVGREGKDIGPESDTGESVAVKSMTGTGGYDVD